MKIDTLLSQDGFELKWKATTNGGEFAGPCPWCGGTDRFCVWPEKDEHGKYWCRGCERKGDAIQYLRDYRGLSYSEARMIVGKHSGKFESTTNSAHTHTEKKVEQIYSYCDSKGKPTYETVRFKPKDFKQRQPDGKGGYIWNLKGISSILYRLPEVMKAVGSGKVIYIVEGEKDVESLNKLELASTCNPMGAGKWRDSYSETLTGANVVIIPDKDELGQRHAKQVAQSLHSKATSIKILELPGNGKDITDWIDAGGTVEELEHMVVEALKFVPEPLNGSLDGVYLQCMADVEAEEICWLWSPYIPLGKITICEGDPGIGKSWLTLAIATAVSLGRGLPGQKDTDPANVLLCSAEDGLADTLKPRLDAMGADSERVFAINGALTFDPEGFSRIEDYLVQEKPVLVIIDPLVAYLGAGVDMHRANETRSVMTQLARMASDYHTAFVLVRHLTKGGMSKSIYRGQGSIDFTAAARSVLLAGCDPDNPQRKAFLQTKSNLAAIGPSVGYELKDTCFNWTGESTLTAEQILSGGKKEPLPRDEAVTFLQEELANGLVPANQVKRDAKDVGIGEKTLERAKTRLGVESKRYGKVGEKGGGAWFWELPGGSNGLDGQQMIPDGENLMLPGLTSSTLSIEKCDDLN